MKKIITVLAVITMLCALGTTAFATTIDSVNTESNSASCDVKAKTSVSTTTPDVYSVDVSWGAMEFTYKVGGSNNWNAADHSYTDNSTAIWTANGNGVTVTNHSNKAITATFGFTKDDAITEDISGAFDIDSEQLDAGVVDGYAFADTITSSLTISGKLDSARTEFVKVGTVTVTIQ